MGAAEPRTCPPFNGGLKRQGGFDDSSVRGNLDFFSRTRAPIGLFTLSIFRR